MTVKDSAAAIIDFLVELKSISPFLDNWCLTGVSKKEALKKHVSLDTSEIESLLMSRKKMSVVDENGFSEIGHSLILWKEEGGHTAGDLYPLIGQF